MMQAAMTMTTTTTTTTRITRTTTPLVVVWQEQCTTHPSNSKAAGNTEAVVKAPSFAIGVAAAPAVRRGWLLLVSIFLVSGTLAVWNQFSLLLRVQQQQQQQPHWHPDRFANFSSASRDALIRTDTDTTAFDSNKASTLLASTDTSNFTAPFSSSSNTQNATFDHAKQKSVINRRPPRLIIHTNEGNVPPIRKNITGPIPLQNYVYRYRVLEHDENFEDDHHSSKHKSEDLQPGIASCLLVLDDSTRLSEWIAYHYTVLPLSRLIILIDPKSSKVSIKRMQQMQRAWRTTVGFDQIILWTDETQDEPEITPSQSHNRRQDVFVNACMKDHKRHNQSWVLLTDTDEFLIYNYPHADDIPKNYFQYLLSWKGPENIRRERNEVKAIRQNLPALQDMTMFAFLTQSNHSDYFASQQPCIRPVGLFFGGEDSSLQETAAGIDKETLQALGGYNSTLRFVTSRYRKRELVRNCRFSKAMIDVSRVDTAALIAKHALTIHNPNSIACGKNGPTQSGQDYLSAVFRIHHYLGSPESFLERKSDARGHDLTDYLKKNHRYSPYTETGIDTDLTDWLALFVKKVGPAHARSLLLPWTTQTIENYPFDSAKMAPARLRLKRIHHKFVSFPHDPLLVDSGTK